MKKLFQLHGFLGLPLAATVLALPLLGASFVNAREYDPFMMYVFPAGGQRGTTIEGIMARGRGLEGTNEVRVSGKGITARVLAIEAPSTRLRQRSANRQDQAENPNVVKFSLTIAPDAELGQRDLWLITPKGPTNRRHFVVGQLPEVNEADENLRKGAPQSLASLPILVNGQYNQGDRDIFRFKATAGQTLVCEAQGRTLIPYIPDAVPGWFQPCLVLYDSTGKELKHVDDFRFHPDPVLIYDVEKDGEYLIEVRDALFRGREDLIYRLAIGALPYITHIFPLGGQRNRDAQVELHGVNLTTTSLNFRVPGDSPPIYPVQVIANGLTSNALPFAVGAHPEVAEAEPNDAIAQANKVGVPLTVNGRIQEGGDHDHFAFSAKKGHWLVMEVRARRLASPIDPVLTLLTTSGRVLAENDDTEDLSEGLVTHHADSYLSYTFRADGDYVLRLREAQGKGGEEYSYRIMISPPRSDFDLRIVPANLSLGRGAAAMAKVKAYRRDGFNGEIRVAMEGLLPGFGVSPAVIAAGQSETRLTIIAPADAPMGVLSPTVTGTAVLAGDALTAKKAAEETLAKIQGQLEKANVEYDGAEKAAAEAKARRDKLVGDARAATARLAKANKKLEAATLHRPVIPAEELMQAFYYWHDVPTEELLVAIIQPTSFTLSTNVSPTEVQEIRRKGAISVVVRVSREGLQGAFEEAKAEKKAAEATLAKVKADLEKAKADCGRSEKTAAQAQAAAAKATTDEKPRLAQVAAEKRRLANLAKALRDRLSVDVKAANTKVTQAGKMVGEANRRARAPINLKADGTLRGITVKPATVPADKDEATITISVTNQAPLGVQQNVVVVGTLKAGQDTVVQPAPAIPIKVLAATK